MKGDSCIVMHCNPIIGRLSELCLHMLNFYQSFPNIKQSTDLWCKTISYVFKARYIVYKIITGYRQIYIYIQI